MQRKTKNKKGTTTQDIPVRKSAVYTPKNMIALAENNSLLRTQRASK